MSGQMQRPTESSRAATSAEEADQVDPDRANPDRAEQAAARDAEVDALLDEIDDVLETNAEEFVAAFVQKGGQ